MTLYYLGRPVETQGACDDGWVWGCLEGKRWSWFWALQLHPTPWNAGRQT